KTAGFDGTIERTRGYRKRRCCFRRVAGSAKRSEQGEEGRYTRLLHGWPTGRKNGRGGFQSRWRGCVIPWRRARYGSTVEPSSSGAKDQSSHVFRYRIERRHAATRCQRQTEGSLRRRESAGRDRGLFEITPWLARSRHAAAERNADLQQTGCGEGLGEARRTVQGVARVNTDLGDCRESVFPSWYRRGGCAS